MSKHDKDDAPLAEIVSEAAAMERLGYVVFQKFTCARCGSRQTMPDAYAFYTSGGCEACGHITDLRRCGFMAINPVGVDDKEKLIADIEHRMRGNDPKRPDFTMALCRIHDTKYALELGGCPLCAGADQ